MSRAKRAVAGDKWALLRQFARLVDELRPDVLSMENVPEIASHSVYAEFLQTLDFLRYHRSASIVHCPAYGVAQSRDRFVLFASRLGPISIVEPILQPSEYPTVDAVIGNLENIDAGGVSSNDPLHRSSNLSELNLKRIQASTPGGTWRDWKKDLRCLCHQKTSGETYPSIYGRMEWGKPAPTMTTQYFGYGNGRFGHPEQDRAISLREGAMLQSFPSDYRFVDPKESITFSTVGRLVGNAVPPRLGVAVGESIRRHIENWRMQNA
jgi:DNA (cytosine-5)-methyltransferase 1